MANDIKGPRVNVNQVNQSFGVDAVATTKTQAAQNIGVSQAEAVALAQQANGDLNKFAELIAARLGLSPAASAAFAGHVGNLRDELDLLAPRSEQALARAGRG